ncbi:NADH-quinone oxidoreductase subunit C [Streptomyces megasporus]|uniref:NADH-quinone oxidoreductase subunit C n=1 Tax=Streptomyces megasporus TaxID=44060 RepID=UPI00068F8422|nr:NADH-quinone oxidoreductase subunit C [Streptomyces megasporus]
MTGPTPPTVGWLPRPAEKIFGEGASASWAYELLTVDVPAERWIEALTAARDELGCTYFDWLSAVDEPGAGFAVCAHLAALGTPVRGLLVRTTVPHERPELPTATGVYAGAAWHERETHEMFGVVFAGHPNPAPLLLPDGFEGHPLRKDFVLAARVAKAWPGAKEPGESGAGGPRRRQTLPPGVPDPNEWGPLKGQLPPAPARSARGRAGADGPGTRPRRMRSASAGSASQRAAGTGAPESPETPEKTPESPATPAPRRMRSASEGSAGQRAAGGAPEARPGRPARRMRSASEGSASQRAAGRPAGEPGRRSTDAPWLKPSEPSEPTERSGTEPSEPPAPTGETSDEAARRVHGRDERDGTTLAEGGGASVANAPEGDDRGENKSDKSDNGDERDGTTGGGA